MTDAAKRFTSEIEIVWDSREPWEATAVLGLADVDAETLEHYCDQTNEEFAVAAAEVLEFVRHKLQEETT